MLVSAPTKFSDHAMLFLLLNIPMSPQPVQPKVQMSDMPTSFKWDRSSRAIFQQEMQSQNLHNAISIENASQLNVNDCTAAISGAIIKAAERCLKKKSKKGRNSKSANKRKWHNSNLACMERDLKRLGILLRNDPYNNDRRRLFNQKKKRLQKKVKVLNQQFKSNLYDRILECDKSNPKEFWSILKQMRESKGNKTSDPDIFFDHFKKLNSKSALAVDDFDKKFENKVLSKLSSYITADHPPVPELDKSIDIEELHSTIQKLPNRKASGGDGILNEMIKSAIHVLSGPLLILFNKILNEGVFPESWTNGIIVPIHKTGNIKDPNNYRGITISSCLGKLFTKILANRLTCWLISNNILAEQQIGFRPGCRTSDHVFVLKSIIDHMKKKRKKVFACFVDFRKAFDSVWRKGLLFKLYKWGIGKKFCSLMDNMYSQLRSCVRIGDRVTEYFVSEVGTRQGCNLSPMIFNLFIKVQVHSRMAVFVDEKSVVSI